MLRKVIFGFVLALQHLPDSLADAQQAPDSFRLGSFLLSPPSDRARNNPLRQESSKFGSNQPTPKEDVKGLSETSQRIGMYPDHDYIEAGGLMSYAGG